MFALRRRRIACAHESKKKPRRRRMSASTVLFSIIAANIFILGTLVFTTLPDRQEEAPQSEFSRNVLSIKEDDISVESSLGEIKQRDVSEDEDDSVSVRDMYIILDLLQDRNGYVRRSQLLAYLLHNNETIEEELQQFQHRTTINQASPDYRKNLFNSPGNNVPKSLQRRAVIPTSTVTNTPSPPSPSSDPHNSTTKPTNKPEPQHQSSDPHNSTTKPTNKPVPSRQSSASHNSTTRPTNQPEPQHQSSVTHNSTATNKTVPSHQSSDPHNLTTRPTNKPVPSHQSPASHNSTTRPTNKPGLSHQSSASHNSTTTNKPVPSHTSSASNKSTTRPTNKPGSSHLSSAPHHSTTTNKARPSRPSSAPHNSTATNKSRPSHQSSAPHNSTATNKPGPSRPSPAPHNSKPNKRANKPAPVTLRHVTLKDNTTKLASLKQELNNSIMNKTNEKLETRTPLSKPTNKTLQIHSNNSHSRETQNGSSSITTKTLPSCVKYTTDHGGLVWKIKPTLKQRSLKELAAMFPLIQNGGHYTPTKCKPKERTAIIIPYRDRYRHLHIMLQNILPLLIKQNVEFSVFVVEQELPGVFNRGMLFNIGFLEATKLNQFDCFIFHDVDLVPINEHNFYHCNQQPTHFLTGVDKFKYKLLYKDMFGGVVAFTNEQFQRINGASNLYFGWGGEDDDLQKRVKNTGYRITRKQANNGLYDMVQHKRDDTNQANPFRRLLLDLATNRQSVEGLNTALYTTHSVEHLPIYTWLKVKVNMTEVLMTSPKYMEDIRNKLLKHFSEEKKNTNVVKKTN